MGKTTPLPIDIIVATVMHRALDLIRGKQQEQDALGSLKSEIEKMLGGNGKVISEPPNVVEPAYDEVARKLLCLIAHNASMANVFKALAAVGAPSSIELIKEGVQAVADKEPL